MSSMVATLVIVIGPKRQRQGLSYNQGIESTYISVNSYKHITVPGVHRCKAIEEQLPRGPAQGLVVPVMPQDLVQVSALPCTVSSYQRLHSLRIRV